MEMGGVLVFRAVYGVSLRYVAGEVEVFRAVYGVRLRYVGVFRAVYGVRLRYVGFRRRARTAACTPTSSQF